MEYEGIKILDSVREYIGYIDDDIFNNTLLSDINSNISIGVQLGIVKPDVNLIDKDTNWEDIFNDEMNKNYNLYKKSLFINYVQLKAQINFDPPPSSHKSIMEDRISELETRLIY